MTTERFGREYYQRFYRTARSSVTSKAEMTARANLIAAYVKHIDCPVGSILDAGCGLGLMRTALLRALPGATYVGLEYSEYLCQKYGWLNGSIAEYRPRQPFDLVVCYDVLQYLDDAAATKAMRNFANLCRGVLFFSALTRRDWRENADQRRTDPAVTMRTADWYRTRPRRPVRSLAGVAQEATCHSVKARQ
ncbi:MAG: class I SAM-dependent methyltransferase, partial [Steroidobacteraceae bacterium]